MLPTLRFTLIIFILSKQVKQGPMVSSVEFLFPESIVNSLLANSTIVLIRLIYLLKGVSTGHFDIYSKAI